jgi:hypothetical protein
MGPTNWRFLFYKKYFCKIWMSAPPFETYLETIAEFEYLCESGHTYLVLAARHAPRHAPLKPRIVREIQRQQQCALQMFVGAWLVLEPWLPDRRDSCLEMQDPDVLHHMVANHMLSKFYRLWELIVQLRAQIEARAVGV